MIAAVLSMIPQVDQILKTIKPFSNAEQVLNMFPRLKSIFPNKMKKVASFLLKIAKKRGYGPLVAGQLEAEAQDILQGSGRRRRRRATGDVIATGGRKPRGRPRRARGELTADGLSWADIKKGIKKVATKENLQKAMTVASTIAPTKVAKVLADPRVQQGVVIAKQLGLVKATGGRRRSRKKTATGLPFLPMSRSRTVIRNVSRVPKTVASGAIRPPRVRRFIRT